MHDHEHDHEHVDVEQAQLGPSSSGSVMLDIGGDIGALILHTGPDLLLAEIDISRVDGGRPLAEGMPLPHQHPHGSHAHDHTHDHDHPHDHDHDHPHDDAPRTHVAVRERHTPDGVRYAAIYSGLPSGDYRVWPVDGSPAHVVTVVGGQIAELDWR